MKQFQWKRAISRVRETYPVLFYIPLFIAGQTIAEWGVLITQNWMIFTLLLIGVFILSQKPRLSWYSSVLATLFAGQVTYSVLIPPRNNNSFERESFVLMRVLEPPRYPQIGRLSLVGEVLQKLSFESDGARVWQPLLEGKKLSCKGVLLPWKNSSELRQGSIFYAHIITNPLGDSSSPFSYEMRLRLRGISGECKLVHVSEPIDTGPDVSERVREYIFDRIDSKLGNGERSGLLQSMAFGKRDVLSVSTEQAFKDAGLAHLLVVSGYQVVMVYHFIVAIAALISRLVMLCTGRAFVTKIGSFVALIFTGIFAVLTGLEGPTIRACLAIVATVIARKWERGGSMLHSILLSLLFIAAIWPGTYFEVGMQLTYSALLGICLGISKKRGSILLDYLAICFYTSVTTSIIVAVWFERFSPMSFILNPIIVPLAGMVSCKGGLVSLLLMLSGVDDEGICLEWVSDALQLFLEGVRIAAAIPGAAFEVTGLNRTILLSVLILTVLLTALKRVMEFLRSHGVSCCPSGGFASTRPISSLTGKKLGPSL